MNRELLQVSLRQSALVITDEWLKNSVSEKLTEDSSVFVANCVQLEFTFSEYLLKIVNQLQPTCQEEILAFLKEVSGVEKNWTPLVKQWNVPTGESVKDHIITFFANVFQTNGTKLECGHIIPENTFPLERYNGCPFCGTPFEFEKLVYDAKNSKLKVLEYWSEDKLKEYQKDLLKSPVALDATQVESLKILLNYYGLPETVEINIKETMVLVIDTLVEQGKSEEAIVLFSSPTDILRYLWYKHTGFLQIIEPKVLINRKARNSGHVYSTLDHSYETKEKAKEEIKLKYTRAECRMYANWLNVLPMNVEKQCEIMHPKRSIWVRVIRALRLAEYSKRKGFENLANLLDVFYNQNYTVWQGQYETFRLKNDAETTFALLKQRPGLFARSLFANILWFGPEITLAHFKEIVSEIPSRLLFTLNMYAELYFNKNGMRSVKPLGGVNKMIPKNELLKAYSEEELEAIQPKIQEMVLEVMEQRYAKVNNENKTAFIDKRLFNMPLAIGDRSESVQDLPSALMGTRFRIEGDIVRLFMQWGEGLPAQHLDMDLSCMVAYPTTHQYCSYSQLTIDGCQHSGDIRAIPDKVGTAEYIDINLDTLKKKGAKYVTFTCNAYSNGEITPNLIVGWMNSKHPMKISEKGVAYNPADVQHQVRITSSVTKGLVFGVLDVDKKEIIWLEMAFDGQLVQNLDIKGTETFLDKLDAKLKVGEVLLLKCQSQGLTFVETEEQADEVYSSDWAINTALISEVLLG